MVSAYQGYCPFRRYSRPVHWAGYLSIPAVWSLGYVLATGVLPPAGLLTVGVGAVLASAVTGLFAGRLYGAAVGSPYGNVTLSLVMPALVPATAYTEPVPDLLVAGDFWTWPEVVVVVAASLVGLGAVLREISVGYARREDPVAWERAVFPHAFRVYRPEGAARLQPRTTERLSLSLDRRGWLLSLLFVAPATGLAAQRRMLFDDQAFSGIMALALFVGLHWGLSVDDGE